MAAESMPAHGAGRRGGGAALVLAFLSLVPLARGFSFPPPAGLVSSVRLEGSAWPLQGAMPPQTSVARRARRIASPPALYARHAGAGGGMRPDRAAAERGGLLATQAERRGNSGMRR